MTFLVIFLLALVVVIVLFSRVANKKKQSALQQALAAQSKMLQGRQPTSFKQGNVTVTVSDGSTEMPAFAQEMLKSMGGAQGILNSPAVSEAVREALRNVGQHHGSFTTTVTTSTSGSPFTQGPEAANADPFDQSSSPFAPTPFSRPQRIVEADDLPSQNPQPGWLGVAEFLSSSTTFDGSRQLSLELDAIGGPKRRVTADVPANQNVPYSSGDRLYVQLDPRNPDTVTIPSSTSGGHILPAGSNRLDPIVLGPEVLRSGAVGTAVVRNATSEALANPALAARGFSKWLLELEVTPERGWPYRAELSTSVSTPEKVARICVAGAQVPVRYDPDDPKSIVIDAVAMGYGNPYV
jgi:hypothetical protein